MNHSRLQQYTYRMAFVVSWQYISLDQISKMLRTSSKDYIITLFFFLNFCVKLINRIFAVKLGYEINNVTKKKYA